ncbi:MAG: flippase [Cyanobacteria bacterium P01_D01_bin.105]
MKSLFPKLPREFLTRRHRLVEVLSNISWIVFDSVFRLSLGLYMSVSLARHLGPVQFGTLSYALVVTTILNPLAKLGLDNILVRDLIRSSEQTNCILGTAFGMRLVASFFTAILAYMIAILLGSSEPGIIPLVAVFSISILIRPFETISLWFQSEVQSKYVSYVRSGSLFFAAIVQIILIWQKASLLTFATLALVEVVLLSCGLIFVYQKIGSGILNWRFNIGRAKSLLQQAWPLIFSSLAITLYMKIDQLMLGHMLGSESVGIYSAATRISESSYFFPIAIVSSLTPSLIRTKEKNLFLYHRRWQQLFSLMVVLGISVATILTLGSVSLIQFLFSESYVSAISVLNIHVWSSTFVFFGLAQGLWDVTENLQKLALVKVTSGSLINIALNIIMIPSYGPVGAAISTLVSYMFVNYLSNFFHAKTRMIFYFQSKAFLLACLFPKKSLA